jgi:hypothetical protein
LAKRLGKLVDDEKRRATTVALKSAGHLNARGPRVFAVVNAAALIWLMSERAIHETYHQDSPTASGFAVSDRDKNLVIAATAQSQTEKI